MCTFLAKRCHFTKISCHHCKSYRLLFMKKSKIYIFSSSSKYNVGLYLLYFKAALGGENSNSLPQIKSSSKMSQLPFLLPKHPLPSKGTFLHIKFFSSFLNEDEINKCNCHIVNYVPEVRISCRLVNIQTCTCEFSSHSSNFTSNCA